MVVTSTNQEVQEQYALYDHYVPSRMEVIAPGVDLSKFSPRGERWIDSLGRAEQARAMEEVPRLGLLELPDARRSG